MNNRERDELGGSVLTWLDDLRAIAMNVARTVEPNVPGAHQKMMLIATTVDDAKADIRDKLDQPYRARTNHRRRGA